MTGEEFMFLSKTASFGCSRPTASRIKKSGRINAAIRQIGRKIVVDVELALSLAGQKKEARRWTR